MPANPLAWNKEIRLICCPIGVITEAEEALSVEMRFRDDRACCEGDSAEGFVLSLLATVFGQPSRV
jgi:hypothetical protein